MDFSSIVRNHSRLEMNRVVVISSEAELKIHELECSILLVLAVWSAPSRKSLACLTETLAGCTLPDKLKLLVVNHDILTEETRLGFFANSLHGWGETFWIQRGEVVQPLRHCQPDNQPDILRLTALLQI